MTLVSCKPAVSYAIITILLTMLSSLKSADTNPCFESITSFGDSFQDTGNLRMLSASCDLPRSARLPYGQTFFHHPTGRFSDGRLIVDFLAEHLGLPYVQPYLGIIKENSSSKIYRNGANFAVAGATAFDQQFYEKRLIHDTYTNSSLAVELEWFRNFLATIPDGKDYTGKSLVLLGTIGANDYSYALLEGRGVREVQSFVPLVVKSIVLHIRELINLGAKTILVPGLPPLGCSTVYLTVFKSSNEDEYDPRTGCLLWVNEFCQYHNEYLQEELSQMRKNYPDVVISYADFFHDALRLFLYPYRFGFVETQKACCGVGGPYNFNQLVICGMPPLVKSCDEPSLYVNWDGEHYTDAAYKVIAQGVLQGTYISPRVIFKRCNSTFSNAFHMYA